MSAKRWRRVYREGRCGDCGWIKRVTRIVFWATGYQMDVCKDCIKPYRKVILVNHPPEGLPNDLSHARLRGVA